MFLAVCAKDPSFRPDSDSITRIVSYLTAMRVVRPFNEERGRINLWSDKNFVDFDIDVRSDPASVSFVFNDNPLEGPGPCEDVEDWARELAVRSFYISFSEVVPDSSTGVDDPRNPVWPLIKRMLGDQEMVQFYCSN